MRTWIAVMIVGLAGSAMGQSAMRVTFPNGASLTANANAQDDSGDVQPIYIQTMGWYKYDLFGKSAPPVALPGHIPEPVPLIALASLRVKFTNDGKASVRWFGRSDLWRESGVAVADGSGVFTVKLVDKFNANKWEIVTVTPIP